MNPAQTPHDLLFGPHSISDDELKRLIQENPALWRRFAVYLGRRLKNR